MLPPLIREQILTALEHFDATLRASASWAGWEDRPAHTWAILHNGRRYPVKRIVALAAGVGVHTFSGGAALTQRLARLGFTVERLTDRPTTAARASTEHDPTADAALHARIATLEVQLIAAQTRTRLALAALAAIAELAQHADGCPLDPCCCGYTEAEARAADITAFCTATTPTLAELHHALTRATVRILALDDDAPRPDLPFGLYDAAYPGTTLLAFQGAKIVGFLHHQHTSITAVESRQYGVGRLFIAHLQERYDALQVPYALADAAPFWEKCGFRCDGPAAREDGLRYTWTRSTSTTS